MLAKQDIFLNVVYNGFREVKITDVPEKR